MGVDGGRKRERAETYHGVRLIVGLVLGAGVVCLAGFEAAGWSGEVRLACALIFGVERRGWICVWSGFGVVIGCSVRGRYLQSWVLTGFAEVDGRNIN